MVGDALLQPHSSKPDVPPLQPGAPTAAAAIAALPRTALVGEREEFPPTFFRGDRAPSLFAGDPGDFETRVQSALPVEA